MRRRDGAILTNLTGAIRAAFPRDAAKLIERELACSPRQARTIAAGKVPGAFRLALIRLLDRAIAENKAKLEEADEAIRLAEYQEMVARAAERRAAGVGANSAAAKGVAGK